MCVQVFKKKDADADELMGLSSAKRGGKKAKKGAEKPAEKPVRFLSPLPAQAPLAAPPLALPFNALVCHHSVNALGCGMVVVVRMWLAARC